LLIYEVSRRIMNTQCVRISVLVSVKTLWCCMSRMNQMAQEENMLWSTYELNIPKTLRSILFSFDLCLGLLVFSLEVSWLVFHMHFLPPPYVMCPTYLILLDLNTITVLW
jgi:hypothetical protein